jgi:hypothetical protein
VGQARVPAPAHPAAQRAESGGRVPFRGRRVWLPLTPGGCQISYMDHTGCRLSSVEPCFDCMSWRLFGPVWEE